MVPWWGKVVKGGSNIRLLIMKVIESQKISEADQKRIMDQKDRNWVTSNNIVIKRSNTIFSNVMDHHQPLTLGLKVLKVIVGYVMIHDKSSSVLGWNVATLLEQQKGLAPGFVKALFVNVFWYFFCFIKS